MPRKKTDNEDIVHRKKQHTSSMNKILRDERLSPRFRFAMEYTSLVLDAKTETDRNRFWVVLMSLCGDSKRLRFNDPDDDTPSAQLSRDEREASAQVRSVWSDLESRLTPKETPDAAG